MKCVFKPIEHATDFEVGLLVVGLWLSAGLSQPLLFKRIICWRVDRSPLTDMAAPLMQGRTQGGARGGLAPPPSTQTYTGRPKRKL